MTTVRFTSTLARHLIASLLGVAFVAAVTPAHAGMARDRLDRFFGGLKAFEATFDQVIINHKGEVIQRTHGTLQIMRPGRFRWEYESPYRQTIVTDGKTLWVYDPDLQQVAESRLDTSVGNTPAILLSTEQPLDSLFRITELPPEDGLAWVTLEPKGRETNFSRVKLAFDERALVSMDILDSFGQTVRIDFTRARRNPSLDPKLFQFTPPPGVDVIGQ
jgi:outer membrane lipoprotein carrier protein